MTRTLTTGGTDVTHFIHDLNGNVIAETGGTGPASTLREDIWLPGAEIAPPHGATRALPRDAGFGSRPRNATALGHRLAGRTRRGTGSRGPLDLSVGRSFASMGNQRRRRSGGDQRSCLTWHG